MRRKLSDAGGAVFVEKLIAYTPLMLLFFLGFQLAELSAAQLVVGRASAAAARAAAVVLPDDPAFYDGTPPHAFEGARRDDVYLAAAMILSAAPQLDGDFVVQVSEPTIADFGPLEVTLSATFHCGGLSLLCGLDNVLPLSATTRQAYHRAEYEYDLLSSPVGGTTQSLSNVAIGVVRQAVTNSGSDPGQTSPPAAHPPREDACSCPAWTQRINTESARYFSGWKRGIDGIHGEFRQGVVGFAIKKGPCTPSGGVMFNRMMDHFNGASTILGKWSNGHAGEYEDNLRSYWIARDAGLSPEDAARATFTGKMSTRRGFTNVRILTETRDAVTVAFQKPAASGPPPP